MLNLNIDFGPKENRPLQDSLIELSYPLAQRNIFFKLAELDLFSVARQKIDCAREVLFDEVSLRRPALLIRSKGQFTPCRWDLAEARLDDREPRAAYDLFDFEGDECCRLVREIGRRVYSEGVPAKLKAVHWLNPFHVELDWHPEVGLLRPSNARVYL
jgi:hypothetical protein